MREFISKDKWKYNERQVVEKGTGKSFTLTQPKILLNEDFYMVKRAIACDNCPVHVIPEKDFYVYEFLYMTYGTLNTKTVDHSTAQRLIEKNLKLFMRGEALQAIIDFFEGR